MGHQAVNNNQFVRHTGVAAPFLQDDFDGELIAHLGPELDDLHHAHLDHRGAMLDAHQHDGSWIGQHAFQGLRYRLDGSENPDFILNQASYRGTPILMVGANFGCGSSREPAVWALDQMGIRTIIARSFGDIFYANCLRNGLLPIALPHAPYDTLAALASGEEPVTLTIDLERCTIVALGDTKIPFDIDTSRRQALLEGLDQLSQTLLSLTDIATFQKQDRLNRPWVWQTVPERPRSLATPSADKQDR